MSDILTQGDVASNIDLLSAWIESKIAYTGQPGLSIGVVYDQELHRSQNYSLPQRFCNYEMPANYN